MSVQPKCDSDQVTNLSPPLVLASGLRWTQSVVMAILDGNCFRLSLGLWLAIGIVNPCKHNEMIGVSSCEDKIKGFPSQSKCTAYSRVCVYVCEDEMFVWVFEQQSKDYHLSPLSLWVRTQESPLRWKHESKHLDLIIKIFTNLQYSHTWWLPEPVSQSAIRQVVSLVHTPSSSREEEPTT